MAHSKGKNSRKKGVKWQIAGCGSERAVTGKRVANGVEQQIARQSAELVSREGYRGWGGRGHHQFTMPPQGSEEKHCTCSKSQSHTTLSLSWMASFTCSAREWSRSSWINSMLKPSSFLRALNHSCQMRL